MANDELGPWCDVHDVPADPCCTRCPPLDALTDAFDRQRRFMEMLRDHDLMPEFPVDMTTKAGQRLVKEVIFNLTEELFEASYTLKNRQHRLTDARLYDREHYVEEVGDAFAYLMELCLLSGISAEQLLEEYRRKNALVVERLRKGY